MTENTNKDRLTFQGKPTTYHIGDGYTQSGSIWKSFYVADIILSAIFPSRTWGRVPIFAVALEAVQWGKSKRNAEREKVAEKQALAEQSTVTADNSVVSEQLTPDKSTRYQDAEVKRSQPSSENSLSRP